MGIEAFTMIIRLPLMTEQAISVLSALGLEILDSKIGEKCVHLEYKNDYFILEANIKENESGVDLRIEQSLCNPSAADQFLTSILGNVLPLCDFEVWLLTSRKPGVGFNSCKDTIDQIRHSVAEEIQYLRIK